MGVVVKRASGATLAVLAVVCGMASCGGTEKRLTRAELARRGDAICTNIDKRFDKAFVDSDLPQDMLPTEKQMQDFVKKIVPIVDDAIADLRDLEPPEDLEERYQAALAQAAKDRKALQSAADDPKAARRLFETREDPFAETNEKLAAVGITECADQDPPDQDDEGATGAPGGSGSTATTTSSMPGA